MKIYDADTGVVRIPVAMSEIEVSIEVADDHLKEQLIDEIAYFLKNRTDARWAIALNGDTKAWSWMHDD